MDVGFVVYDGLGGISGGYRYDRKLVSHLREQGDRVEVITVPRRRYTRALADNLRSSVRAQLDKPVDVLLQDELCHPSLWRHNQKLANPEVVVSLVHLVRSADPTASRTAAGDALSRTIERRYLRSVDAAIATSRHTEEKTLELAPELDSTVVYPGGRLESAAISPELIAEHADEGPLRILFVGTLEPRKGPLTLLDSLATLDGDWAATLVGNHEAAPRYASRVRRRAKELDGERIAVHGCVSDRELETLFRWADVLAVPSQYEGFGMVYLEAMEYGVVPVATTHGGAGEVVADGENGLLVAPDVRELHDALTALESDREQLLTLAAGALETAENHPNWTASMHQLRTFLSEQLTRGDGCS